MTSPGRSRRTLTVVLAVTLAAYAVLAVRQLGSGLEFDEAFNLTVVKNLASGHGYATNAPLGRSEGRKLFDPYISTGPALLVPAALVWRVTGGLLPAVRLVPLGYFALFLWALWKVTRDRHDGWLAWVALSSPLLLAAGVPDLSTVSLVPGRVVGELAALALVLAAVVALDRERAVLAGLLAGFAVQTKSSFVLVGAALLLTWLAVEVRRARRMPWGRALGVGAAAAAPTVAFELYRLMVLGPEGYRRSTHELGLFMHGQSGAFALHPDRLEALLGVVSIPGLVLLGSLLVAFAGLLLARGRSRGVPDPGGAPADRPGAAYLGALVGSTGLLLVLWLTVSTQPSARQGLPFLLAGLPVTVTAMCACLTSGPAGRSAEGLARTLVTAGLVVTVVLQAALVAADSSAAQLREDQQRAVEVLRRSGTPSLPVYGWMHNPEFQVLTELPLAGAPGAGAATVDLFTSIQAKEFLGVPAATALRPRCSGAVLLGTENVVVCRKAPF